MASPVHVAISGTPWNTILLLLLNIFGGGIIVALIKRKPALKEIEQKREANLLTERAEEMEAMRKRLADLETKLEQKDAQHDADRARDRHRMNNLSQCLDALLLLIEQDPDKAAEAAAKIRKMRAEQLVREAAEAATIRAATITGVAT